MIRVLFLLAAVFLTLDVNAADIVVGEHYIANANFDAKVKGTDERVVIGRENRVKVVDIDGTVVLLDITSVNSELDEARKTLMLDSFVYVDTSDTDLTLYLRKWDAVGHGGLVVPFKVSLKDKTLSTKSVSLGYYLQVPRWRTAGGTVIGPIYSFGLSSITRSESENTELGLTLALGFVWALEEKFQIGVIIGKDHLGDDTWKYEDETWVSAMVGFNFLQ